MPRVAGLIVVAPIFGSLSVPLLSRAGFAALTAMLLVGPVQEQADIALAAPLFADPWRYGLLLAGEFFVGAALGYIVLLFFTAVQVAGHLMDVPLGFGMVNILDPQTGQEVPVLGQLKFALAILLFFTVNGHHAVLLALGESYRGIPPGAVVFQESHLALMTRAFSTMFLLGVRIAFPIMAAAFLTDAAMAIVARAVPQINVFITGFPLKILGAMFVLIVVLPAYVALVGTAFGDRGEMVRFLWSFIGGG